MKALLLTIIFSGILFNVKGTGFRTPEVSLPLMKQSPVIDGKINAPEWAGAVQMQRFCYRGENAFPAPAAFWLGSDGKMLYIAARCAVGPGGILERVRPSSVNAMAWLDDGYELVFVPNLDAAKLAVFHMIVNNRGAVYSRSKIANAPQPWRPEFKCKGSVKSGFWDFEFAVPIDQIGIKNGKIPAKMGIRICRNWKRLVNGNAQTSWTNKRCAFFGKDAIPVVCFDRNAPVVQVTQLKDPGSSSRYNIKVNVANPGDKTIKVKVSLRVKPKNSADNAVNKTIELQPGHNKTIFADGAALNSESITTCLDVSSPDSGKIFYRREFIWTLNPAEELFSTAKGDAERIGAKFAYYPSFDKMRLRVDVSALKNKAQIKDITVELKSASGKTLGKTAMPKLKDYVSDKIWSIPDLKKYSLKGENKFSVIFDIKGVKGGRIKKEFVRNIMPWENCSFGKSNKIVPPFTPIEIDGMTVDTVLRRHKLNKLGLWEQVTASQVPLLKNTGMRLEAVVAGRLTPVNVSQFDFTIKKADTVEFESVFSAGALKGSAKSLWDYDGMMKWTLTLAPCKQKVDSLKLVIPLDDSNMPLFHTCTDGIRINYGGAVPAGKGKIWNGAKCARNSIKGTYVPYIWLGDELRGLSVFGENDKGWVTSDKVPCQELIRDKGILYLILNLIAAPAELKKARTITIGFMATPIKPMPENWRKWNAWSWYGAGLIKQFDYDLVFLGSCWYWGAVTPCLDIYPRKKDVSYWHKLGETRRTGKVDQVFINDWIKAYPLPGKPGSERYEKMKKTYFNHVRSGFHTIKGAQTSNKKSVVMFYTNGRGVRWDTPEGKTFVDEWFRIPFIKRSFNYMAGAAYDLDPCESYRNYAMWWYKRMFDTGANDLLYWDDIFLQSNFNLVGSDAYLLPDGSIQPASGVFNMRELIRRTAVFQREIGKPANNMAHMTNTAIAPILSFARMNYDWEDHNGHSDFQERYTREYIRTLSIGRQFGNFPVVLAPVSGTNAQQQWCIRTATGAMLTHELRWTNSQAKKYWHALKKLYDFGYGERSVQVFNYWNKKYPVKINGIESSSLVLKKKGAVLLVVCDYGNGGDVSLSPDLKCLGLDKNFLARNLETGANLKVVNESIRFKIKKHDYIMILLHNK